MGPLVPRSVGDARRGRRHDRIGLGAVPLRSFRLGSGEPGTQHGDEQEVDQTVEHGRLTGLVLLSSGVWQEKHQNRFQRADLLIVSGHYDDTVAEHRDEVLKGVGYSDEEITLIAEYYAAQGK